MTTFYPISLIIPMFNEADNARPLLLEIYNVFSENQHHEYEIIVVDDGSNDETPTSLKALVTELQTLRILRHKKNFGQSASIISGVRAARYPWIITLDGDGQNDPADIPKLMAELAKLEPIKQPVLFVGNRKKRNDSWLRRFSSGIANKVRTNLLQDDCPDTGCGLKLFHRETFLKLPHFNHVHRFLPALFKRAGGRVINIPVNHRPRLKGYSKYGVMNRLWVGIVDLFGVAWLLRRPCNPEVES